MENQDFIINMNDKETKEKIRAMLRKRKTKGSKCVLFRDKVVKSTLQWILVRMLPTFLANFIYSPDNECRIAKVLYRAILGFLVGVLLYIVMVMPIYSPQESSKLICIGMAAIVSLTWTLSAWCRCITVMVFPQMLANKANVLIWIVAITGIYQNFAVNIVANAQEIFRSGVCVMKMQADQLRLKLEVTTNIFRTFMKDLKVSVLSMKDNIFGMKKAFAEVSDEVESREGYNADTERKLVKEEEKKQKGQPLNTQQKFALKNLLRCEGIMEANEENCHKWFQDKYLQCKERIVIPLIDKLLCLPMKMTFLCKATEGLQLWCKKFNPLPENFGSSFDKVNDTMETLESGLDIDMDIEKADESRAFKNPYETVKEAGSKMINETKFSKIKSVIKVPIVCGVLIYYLFVSYLYVYKYNRNIFHDNNYITTYFRLIDCRRRRRNLRHLLPLRRGEYVDFIFPFKMKLQGEERDQAAKTLYSCMVCIAVYLMAFFVAYIFGETMNMMDEYGIITYSYSSRHKLEFLIEGKGFLPNILRATLGKLNTSSNVEYNFDNSICVPKAQPFTSKQVCGIVFGIAFMLLAPVLQAYVNRLPRAIGAIFFPKREKGRILHLYNKNLIKRAAYTKLKRKQVMLNAKRAGFLMSSFVGTLYRQFKFLRRFLVRRCMVCNAKQTRDSYECQTEGCYVIYCRQCWKDMRRYCYACMPVDHYVSDVSESDYEFEELN
ncbi:E3 ubiquitin-protein ligase DCST1 [Xenopus laevis]|uniref:E3 ubiquitin-protein ligase DCST1 n=2 Tax=Xenopus laevis TaxID=8355 RepID=A0A1L8FVB1_XENLA|nr:E3 ubiquitin-protein ligase DCST1 [Xenopus laevis]OCT75514.1 hypothetical protein XELAEV_18030694mg [Xenopus laevis]